MEANLEIFTNDKYRLLKWIADNEVQYRKAKYLSSSQQEIADTLHYSKSKTNRYMNELIELNYLKRYKEKGKYAIIFLKVYVSAPTHACGVAWAIV